MVDRVKPLKLESPSTGGTQLDEYPTSLNPNEDNLDAKGLFIQNDTSDDELVHVTRDNTGNMTFKDAAQSSPKTLTQLLNSGGAPDPEQHRLLDQLTHNMDESYYMSITRSSNGLRITNVTYWTDSTMTKKIREYQYTYNNNRITGSIEMQYDSNGVISEQLTATYSYNGWRLTSTEVVRA